MSVYDWNKDLEKTLDKIGMKKNLFWDLGANITDDWSFVIKLGAILETVVQHYILLKLPVGMTNTIDELGFQKKLDLAKDIEVIDKDQYDLFKWLKNQRNLAAHNFDYSLDNHLKERCPKGYLNNQELFYNKFKGTFSEDWYKPIGLTLADDKSFMLENPRVTIFFGMLQPIALIHALHTNNVAKNNYQDQKEKTEHFLNTIKEMFGTKD